jgi:hypothetical protein
MDDGWGELCYRAGIGVPSAGEPSASPASGCEIVNVKPET